MLTKYFYAGGVDAAWGQVTDATLTRTVGLPGGVSQTITGAEVTWSFPNLQGHTLLTRPGTTTTGPLLWDPFGQPLDPVTLAIGTTASDDAGPLAGNTGWHQGALKQAATVGSTTVGGKEAGRASPRSQTSVGGANWHRYVVYMT